jgi:hypothetical protein
LEAAAVWPLVLSLLALLWLQTVISQSDTLNM